MRFRVDGADVKDGHDRYLVIEADSSAAAESLARAKGMLVSGVTQSPPDPLSQLANAVGDAPRNNHLNYGTMRPPGQVPDYLGLQFGAIALRVMALLSYATGAITLFAAVASSTGVGGSFAGRGLVAGIGFLMSLWPFAVGAILHAGGAACDALRDIARNSWRLAA